MKLVRAVPSRAADDWEMTQKLCNWGFERLQGFISFYYDFRRILLPRIRKDLLGHLSTRSDMPCMCTYYICACLPDCFLPSVLLPFRPSFFACDLQLPDLCADLLTSFLKYELVYLLITKYYSLTCLLAYLLVCLLACLLARSLTDLLEELNG